jgi:pimeloyl-ACP methyl ester carboxylesterase
VAANPDPDALILRDAEGAAFTYREAGAGAALVLLHGIGSGAASWAGQLDRLAAGHRVIAWDAPGYGGSDALAAETPAAADYGAALARFLDALGVTRCVLVGHSLGALMAAALCRAVPGRVRAMVLADPAAGYGHADDTLRIQRLQARLEVMARLGPAGMAEERAPQVLSPAADAATLERVRIGMRRLNAAGYAQAARMLHAADIFDDLPSLTMPVLVMCGSADLVTPEEGCRRIAAAVADGSYRTLQGLGHASYVENPAMFNDALAGFLDGLR